MLRTKEGVAAYEQSEVWRERRSRYLHENNITRCQGCGKHPPDGKSLQVHHGTYREAGAGQEPDRHLWALCGDCHLRVHTLAKQTKKRSKKKKRTLWEATMMVLMPTDKYRKLK
jgi:5-methylcytosine-specific restriction endonuclease McrA